MIENKSMINSNPNFSRLKKEIEECKAQIDRLTVRLETLQEAYEIISAPTTPTNKSTSMGKDSIGTTTLYFGQECNG